MSDIPLPRLRTVMEALQRLVAQGQVHYKVFSDEWVIKYWRGGREHFIIGYFNFDFNSQAGAEIAFDKVATYQLLADAGLAVVPHILLTSPASPEPSAAQLDDLFKAYGSLVVKPTNGSSGREIARCNTPDTVRAHIAGGSFPSWCASPLRRFTAELRLACYDGEVWLAYRKQRPVAVNGVPMFNLAHGAAATRLDVGSLDPGLKDMAARAMRAIGLRFGAVDIVLDEAGEPSVLEINSRFTLEHYAGFSAANRQEVVAFYERVFTTVLNNSSHYAAGSNTGSCSPDSSSARC